MCSTSNISCWYFEDQTENIPTLINFVLSIIWKVQRGTWDVFQGMARLPSCCTKKPSGLKTPAPLHSCTYHVQFLSITYHSLHICTNAVWKLEFNGYYNECWRNGSEKQEEGDAGERREVCLDVRLLSGFHEDECFGGNVIIFSLCFPLVHKGVVSYKKAGRSLDTHH